MHIVVSGKQVETGEALRTHVTEGLQAVTKKYFDHALEAHVTFFRNRAFFACTIDIHAGRGLNLRGEGEGPDAHRAFDEAASHIAKRLRRYRRRVNEHFRNLADTRLPSVAETAREVILARPPEEPDEPIDREILLDGLTDETPATEETAAGEHDGQNHSAIVAETPTEIARLTVSEAVMRLDLSQAPVMMFRNQASGQLNVVYRRPDGHVGWIDPTSST